MVRVVQKFDINVLNNVHINQHTISNDVKNILAKNPVISEANFAAWLLKAVSVIDLTTLSGDDTAVNVRRLCHKASRPIEAEVCQKLGLGENKLRTAAVCVYPTRVSDAHTTLKQMELTDQIQIAAVATGFPSGLYPIETRLQEITYAIMNGATEIDVVLDRSLVLSGKWTVLYDEVVKMRKACNNAHLKVILGVGELGSLENVYKASMISMMAGADFIKTSTGKEAVNATLPIGLVMCRAIRHFYRMTGAKIGLKPAGGIKTPRDAVNWLVLINSELGPEWLSPQLFRIGASSLLGGIEKWLNDYVYGFESQDDRYNFI